MRVINRSFVLDRTWWLCSFRSFCYICYGFSTVHAYTRSRLGSDFENESLQNEADRSIFTSKFVFVLVTKSTQQKSKSK